MAKGINRLLVAAWQLVPHRRRVLESLACLPPAFKGRLLDRVARVGMGMEGYGDADELPTNFAVAGVSVRLPVRAGSPYFFNKPANFFGEAATIRLCHALVDGAGAFVDIGAHLGLYLWSLSALARPERPLYFFEPHPDLFRIVATNAVQLTPHIKGFPMAVSNDDGISDFYISTYDWSMSTLVEAAAVGHHFERISVECVRFDTFAKRVGLENAVVKADIEGGEAGLLDGMASSNAVSHFVCEVLELAYQEGFVASAARRLAADAYLIHARGLTPAASASQWDRTEHNWLFTQTPQAELRQTLAGHGLRIL